ncbi:MAG: phenylalanine--tRNA ligase subunit alpha [Negativicutes bacterium]|nr:phenylalanine--tRNA ligase subunit alpha [Negativicutes bacterium]
MKKVVIGKISAPHGVRGEVRIVPLTDFPERFENLKTVFLEDDSKMELESVKFSNKFIIAKFKNINSRNDIEIFNGKLLMLNRSDIPSLPEGEYYNFDMLNFAQDHPARDMQDTYYTKIAPNVILRSQTTNAQARTLEVVKPPIRVIDPGRVYRNETVNARKNNFFHQIEGLYVDKGVTMGDLKGVLNEFIRLYFGSSRITRFRSSFFPFTEPSVEIDVQCIMCGGKGCRTCSQTGWLEILGAGMVDVNVLKSANIDPEVYTGFAFGMGVERLAMLKYAIDDIRLFFNNDVRFLNQF